DKVGNVGVLNRTEPAAPVFHAQCRDRLLAPECYGAILFQRQRDRTCHRDDVAGLEGDWRSARLIRREHQRCLAVDHLELLSASRNRHDGGSDKVRPQLRQVDRRPVERKVDWLQGDWQFLALRPDFSALLAKSCWEIVRRRRWWRVEVGYEAGDLTAQCE